jgi:predicted DNA-binding transcriptional regulator YafY
MKNTNFHVKPLKLAFFDGFWYLLALHIKKIKKLSKNII